MEGFTLKENDVPGMLVKTHSPVYKFTLKWMIDQVSKLFSTEFIRSPDFQVDPKSTWYAKLSCLDESFTLVLCRTSGNYEVKANFELKISGSIGEILFQHSGAFYCSAKGKEKNVIASNVLNSLPKMKYPVNDQLLIVISLEVHTPFVTWDWTPSSTTPWPKLSLPDHENRAKMVDKTISQARFSALVNLLKKISDNNDNMNDSSLHIIKQLMVYIHNELLILKDTDFDSAIYLYRTASKFAMTELRDECLRNLLSKVTPDNFSNVFTSLSEN